MTVLEKVLFLQKSYNLNDRAFCSRFRIKYGLFKKWKTGSLQPESKYLFYLCCETELDFNDFISENSTLTKETIKEGEHLCAIHKKNKPIVGEALEDFPREDNSRYEEKD